MNTLPKVVVGAAIAGAGAVIALLVKQRWGRRAGPTAGLGRKPPGSKGFTVEELTDENAEWGGGSSGLKNA